MKYDFEYLKKLYIDDPDAFMLLRTEILNEFIEKDNSEAKQKNLRAQQWKIDQILSKYNNPIARMNKMIELFWSGVDDLINISKIAGNNHQIKNKKSSQVIDFVKKTK